MIFSAVLIELSRFFTKRDVAIVKETVSYVSFLMGCACFCTLLCGAMPKVHRVQLGSFVQDYPVKPISGSNLAELSL